MFLSFSFTPVSESDSEKYICDSVPIQALDFLVSFSFISLHLLIFVSNRVPCTGLVTFCILSFISISESLSYTS